MAKSSMPVLNEDELFDGIAEALVDIGIDEEPWDLLIVGDGSGSSWGNPCGWAAVLVERQTCEHEVFYGAVNSGTSNLAEMWPYVHGLSWYLNKHHDDGLVSDGRALREIRVHVITDSSYVRKTGESTRKGVFVSRNRVFWTVLSQWQRLGVLITWHHRKREKLQLNRYVDKVSKWARKTLTGGAKT